MIPDKVRKILKKQHYEIVGKNSAVQICHWTKKSLREEGVCWKEKFYGIKSHRCCQFSPSVMWCENQCLHCWRPIEMNLGTDLGEIDEPEEIIKGVINARKKLLMGFKSNKKTSARKFKESLEPTLFTMSLSGEPTLYSKISGLIKEIKKRKAVSFLVTNGLNPEILKKLAEEKNFPTQITVSTNTPNEKLFNSWHCSSKKNAWKKFNDTLKLLKSLKGRTRRVIRLTLVKEGDSKEKFKEISNMKDEHILEYAVLIRKAEPDFIHVKGFKSLGYSRQRMGYSKQPFYDEVLEFAKKLAKELKSEKYKILAKDELSCVVLIGKDKKMMKIKKKEG
ncbi:MAG: 4-demethylwyosine synthase TYW1 [archaeon]